MVRDVYRYDCQYTTVSDLRCTVLTLWKYLRTETCRIVGAALRDRCISDVQCNGGASKS